MNKSLIVISAVWCTSCLIVSNNLKQIAREFPALHIVNLDYDLDEDKIAKYNVGNTLPVIIIVDEANHEIDRLIGEKSYTEIKNFLINN